MRYRYKLIENSEYIIKDVRETYAHNSLSDKARAEVLALLREYGMDGLPEDIKNYRRNQQALEEMITRLRRIEEDRIKNIKYFIFVILLKF